VGEELHAPGLWPPSRRAAKRAGSEHMPGWRLAPALLILRALRAGRVVFFLACSAFFCSTWAVRHLVSTCMTRNLLQSDLDLVRRLISDERADVEIVAVLRQRGIDALKAQRVVGELRSGRSVSAEVLSTEQPISTGAAQADLGGGARGPIDEGQSGQRRSHRRASSAARWVTLTALLCLVVLGIAGLLYQQRYHAESRNLLDELARAPQQPGPLRTRIAERKLDASESERLRTLSAPQPLARDTGSSGTGRLVLDLQADGLHAGGILMTPQNALQVVAQLLGPPTRTNHLEQTSQLLHTFDNHGLLIYSGDGGEDESILLDFEGSGGKHGARSPFTGALRAAGNLIQGDTDESTLSGMNVLGLSVTGGAGGTLQGRYGSLELSFAYYKSARHLSVVVIKLK